MIYTNESNHVYKFKYIHTFKTISRYWVIPSLIINYFPYFHILYKIHILFFFSYNTITNYTKYCNMNYIRFNFEILC